MALLAAFTARGCSDAIVAPPVAGPSAVQGLEMVPLPRSDAPPTLTDVEYAIHANDVAGLQRMLDAGMSPGVILEDGWAALQRTAFCGHQALARLLISRGARIDLFSAAGLGLDSQCARSS
jgi:hypothetical protein